MDIRGLRAPRTVHFAPVARGSDLCWTTLWRERQRERERLRGGGRQGGFLWYENHLFWSLPVGSLLVCRPLHSIDINACQRCVNLLYLKDIFAPLQRRINRCLDKQNHWNQPSANFFWRCCSDPWAGECTDEYTQKCMKYILKFINQLNKLLAGNWTHVRGVQN